MKVCVSKKPESKRGKGLKVPWLETVKVSGYIFSKSEPIIKDLLIAYIRFKEITLFMLLFTASKEI